MVTKSKIVGRVDEIAQLEKAYHSKKAEFITVYGRRRIGKTYLIRQFFLSKDCLYFQMTGIYKGAVKTQLKEFVTQVKNTLLPSYAHLETPSSWMNAFKVLTDILTQQKHKKKVVLFLDELPWMARKSTALLQALEYYWNQYWSHMTNVKLIVCGSVSSWVIKNIIKNKGGLHNRTTLRLPMEPFNLHETKAFLEYEGIRYDEYQTLQIYMVMGGVPYYLSLLNKGVSAQQNINQLCFQKKGGLLDEFSLLLASLFENEKLYEQLIRAISEKRYGVSREDLEKKLRYKGGSLTRRLTDLENIGFITSFSPWGRKKKGLCYRIIDEYIWFYLSWIEPSLKAKLPSEGKSKYWEQLSETSAWNAWAGYAFEAVCFKHISQIRRALHVPDSALAYTWRYFATTARDMPGAQIDLIFDRQDHIVNLCEIKYSKKAYVLTKAENEVMLNRVKIFRETTKTDQLIFISFITTFGLKASTQLNQFVNSVAVLSDLFLE